MRRRSSCLAVLIVDDDLASGMWLSTQIKAHGHQVWRVCSGSAALMLSEQHFFDLIMTDCYMQGMSGFKLTQTLRQRLTTEKVVIVGMTASNCRAVLARGIAVGMDECVTKPLSKEKISKLIHSDRFQHITSPSSCAENFRVMYTNELMQTKQTHLQTMMPGFLDRSNEAIKMKLAGTRASAENIQLRKTSIDIDQERRHYIDDISPLVRTGRAYKERIAPQQQHAFLEAIWHANGVDMCALEKAITSQDSTRVAYLAHKLRGIALVAGRADIADIADKVEKACQNMPKSVLIQHAQKLHLSLVSFNQDIMVQLCYSKAS